MPAGRSGTQGDDECSSSTRAVTASPPSRSTVRRSSTRSTTSWSWRCKTGCANSGGVFPFAGAGPFGTGVGLPGRFFPAKDALPAGVINRVAPPGTSLDPPRERANAGAKTPPLSVRATVRSRRWYMDQLGREIVMQMAPLKLYLTEDFQEAARAFTEKRPPAPFKGR